MNVLITPSQAQRLQINTGARGRGLFLCQDIPKDEIIFELSPDLFISPSILNEYVGWDEFCRTKLAFAFGKDGQAIVLFSDFNSHHDAANFVMAIFLCFIKQHLELQKPHVKYFLSYLPKAETSHPVFWLAKYSDLVRERETLLEADHYGSAQLRFLQSALSAFETLKAPEWTREDFLWAMAITLSRSWKYGESSMIAPVFDLCNHDSEAANVMAPSPSGSLVLTASSNLKAGDELLLSYGSEKSAWMLLLCYGFLPPPLFGNDVETIGKRILYGFQQQIHSEDQEHTFVVPDTGEVPLELLAKFNTSELLGYYQQKQKAYREFHLKISQDAEIAHSPASLFVKLVFEELRLLDAFLENMTLLYEAIHHHHQEMYRRAHTCQASETK